MITNKEIKFLKSLSYKKYRYEHKLFLVEGLRLIEELLNSHSTINQLWTTEDFLNDNPSIKKKLQQYSNIALIDEKYFHQILNTENPQYIMASLPIEQSSLEKITTNNLLASRSVLILDGLSDPGNMGSLLRSAVWYGFDTIILSDNCVDVYNPKVVRSAMGAHFYISNIITGDLIKIVKNLKINKYRVIGATLDGTPYKKIEINHDHWGLILGNEAHGIRKELYNLIDEKVSIPSHGPIESLNVAIAGSILLDRLIHK